MALLVSPLACNLVMIASSCASFNGISMLVDC